MLVLFTHNAQVQNLHDAIDKLQAFVDAAVEEPKERIPTVVPEYAKREKMNEKKLRSAKKASRGGGGGFDY